MFVWIEILLWLIVALLMPNSPQIFFLEKSFFLDSSISNLCSQIPDTYSGSKQVKEQSLLLIASAYSYISSQGSSVDLPLNLLDLRLANRNSAWELKFFSFRSAQQLTVVLTMSWGSIIAKAISTTPDTNTLFFKKIHTSKTLKPTYFC